MKRFKKHRAAVSISLLLLSIFTGGIAFKRGGWELEFEPKCRLHAHRTKPHYKAYRIEWCEGISWHEYADGSKSKFKHHYKIPTFHHVDIEQLMKKYPVVITERFKNRK